MLKKFCLLGVLSVAMASATSNTVSTITESFQASGALSVGPNGNVYVADYGAQTTLPNGINVYKVNHAGQISTFATGIRGASGNKFDKSGALYQSSYVDNKVYKINQAGEATVFAQGKHFNGPVGIEFDSKGAMYVANCNNNSIAKKTGDKLDIFISSPKFACPAGLAIDENDNLYVTQYANGDIYKIDTEGNMTLLASAPGGKTKVNGGNGHITYGNGMLYFVSGATHQVYSLSLSGQLKVVTGTGTQGRADGNLASAEFSLPNGIDISADGKVLYINDSETVGNDTQVAPNVVRKVILE